MAGPSTQLIDPNPAMNRARAHRQTPPAEVGKVEIDRGPGVHGEVRRHLAVTRLVRSEIAHDAGSGRVERVAVLVGIGGERDEETGP